MIGDKTWKGSIIVMIITILINNSFMLFFLLLNFLASENVFAIPSHPQEEVTKPDYLKISQAFTRVANAVIPTVVSITSTMMVRTSDLWDNKFDDKELREFFGEKYFNFPVPREFRQKGSGSGLIVTRDGHILTNMHVVDQTEKINVTLADNRSFAATLVGADPLSELALIKIEGGDLPVAEFGNSDSVQIGEWVLAIGNPLELRSTVTAGIISAIGRDVNIIADNYGVENFIQTDAAINPGNSGGALVNLKGQVIGINTAIATQTGYSQGYGFAIPVNLAKEIMKELMRRGYVVRSYLGVSMKDVDEKITRALNLSQPTGVFIDYVTEDSPAQLFGLREKDVIVKIDNQVINKGNLVQSIIAQKKPGDELLFTVIRGNRLLKIPITLGERKGVPIDLPPQNRERKFPALGLMIENISRHVAEESDLKIGEGVLVTAVEQFSPAFDAGVQANDVILEIDDRLITSVYAFDNTVAELRNGNVTIFKLRRAESIFHVFIEVNK